MSDDLSSPLRHFARTRGELPGWFWAGSAASLAAGKIRKLSLTGQSIVIFRSPGGELTAMDGRCAHLGADLAQGRVVQAEDGERIVCPFHHWCYDRAGRCRGGPGLQAIPERRLAVFPVRERWGYLWVFLGAEPLFDLPILDERGLGSGGDPWVFHVGPVALPAHPHLCLANGLDAQHFQTLHQLEFVVPARITQIDAYSVSNLMRARPQSARLRFLTRTRRDAIEGDYVTYGANLGVLQARLARVSFAVLFNPHLQPDGSTHNHVLFFVPRPYASTCLRMLSLLPLLLNQDGWILRGLNFQPGLVPEDTGLAAFAQVVERLADGRAGEPRPQSPGPWNPAARQI